MKILRRISLGVLLLVATRVPSVEAQGARAGTRRTFVIVHGAWGGAWAFKRVDSLLTAQGAKVYRVSLTGLGERVHLASPDVDLSTHVRDVINVLRYEELRDVVLVGHSYGGMVITGVADEVPERIQRLVYVDAFLPDSGESVVTALRDGLPIGEWSRDGMIVPPWIGAQPKVPGDVPHPLKTFTQPLTLRNPARRGVPATYVLTVDSGATDDTFSPFASRARARGWPVVQMTADHNPQMSNPAAIARVLLTVGLPGENAVAPAERPGDDWGGLRRYRDANAKLGPPKRGEQRVVFMGNSITDSWAQHFPAMFPGKPYIGRGIGGQTTPQMLVRFRQDVIALQPRVVVILAGTNDIAGNTGPSTVAMIEDNLASMVDVALANGIRVVLSSVLPVYDYPWRPGLQPAPKIVELNAWMKAYAARRGIVFVDYHSAMADARQGLRAELGSDGVHPNEAGYRIMAPLVERGIAQALRSAR